MATTIPCHYQDPASEQTLREGYAEYVHANPELLDPDALGKAGRFFRAHDYVHVLFGCDTSVIHEALMDTWTIFGTTAGWRELTDYYKDPQQRAIIHDIVRQIGFLTFLWTLFAAAPRAFRVIRNTRKMTEKWPLYDHQQFLDVPLVELRRRFNIQVVR